MLRRRLASGLFLTAGAVALAAWLTVTPAPSLAAADNFNAGQRSEIEEIVRGYLLRNPELLQEAMQELEKRQAAAETAKAKEAVKDHTSALFNSSHQVVIGNPQGDVTLVEFFDYNCGFCKRALGDLVNLINDDPKLRVVLKEFPVLGQGSVEAAQIAVAVRMQDKTGKKYFDFHQKLLSQRGQADKAHALAAAKDAGFDMTRLERDLSSAEVRASLDESMKLAEALGLNGTPSYVIGDDVVMGAVGFDALKKKVSEARCGQISC